MRLLMCLALVLLAGCSQADIDPAPAAESPLFEASAMRIHPIFTEVKDWTGDGTPDGLEVLLEFQDRFGDPTKAAGTVMFELYDYRRTNPDPRGSRLANPWIGSITTMGEQTAHWNRTSRTYSFQLAFPTVEASKSYVLTAMFRSADGRFFDRVVLESLEPEQEQPGERSAESRILGRGAHRETPF
jgi:hypothetical protein